MTSRLSSPTEPLSDGLSARRLTPEVIDTLARFLVEGRTRAEIAERLDVSVRTVSRWRSSPLVIAEVERLENRSDEVRAADVLLRLMESDDERISLRAAELVLTHRIQRTPHEAEPPVDEPAEATAAVVIRFEGKTVDDDAEIVIENGEIVG